MILVKIISGGQTGADRGGLLAGEHLGLLTGGTAPLGWITEEGPQEALLKRFGLTECPVRGYQVRTEQNIMDADATVIFAQKAHSPGTVLTIKTCHRREKPFLVNPSARALREWAEQGGFTILNVAGNRASVDPSAEGRAFQTLVEAFTFAEEVW